MARRFQVGVPTPDPNIVGDNTRREPRVEVLFYKYGSYLPAQQLPSLLSPIKTPQPLSLISPPGSEPRSFQSRSPITPGVEEYRTKTAFPHGLVTDFHLLPQKFTFPLTHVETVYKPIKRGAPATLRDVSYDNATAKAVVPQEGKLGEGSFGKVIQFGSRGVMKVAAMRGPSDPMYKIQIPGVLMDEALAILRINSPNIVSIWRSFLCADDADHFIAIHIMEKMSGDLQKFAGTHMKNTEISDSLGRMIEYDGLKGLADMHSMGYIHKDLKPGNMLWVEAPGRQPHPFVFKLGDFGAVTNNPNQTLSGTYQFLAPECVAPRIQTQKSDVWALFASLWEIRFGTLPLLAIFPKSPEIKTRLDVRGAWRQLASNPEALNKHIMQMLTLFWGITGNPGDAFVGIRDGVLSREWAVKKQPEWDKLLHYHTSVSGVCYDGALAFMENLKRALIADPAARPTAHQLLDNPEYFAGITASPASPAIPANLPDGAAMDNFKSLWYMERGGDGDRDSFETRLAMGLQSTQQVAIMNIGPKELVPKNMRNRWGKPKKILYDKDVVAVGNGYYLFDWCDGNTLLSIHGNVRGNDFWANVKSFCEAILGISKDDPSVLPFLEYHIEGLGATYVIHFVIQGKWRHMGAIPHDTEPAILNLLGGLLHIGKIFRNRKLGGHFFLSSLWVNDHGIYRLNLPIMYKAAIGHDSLQACLTGTAKTMRSESRHYTPNTIWSTLSRFSMSSSLKQTWGTLIEADWDKVFATLKLATVDYQNTLRVQPHTTGSVSPRMRITAIDTCV